MLEPASATAPQSEALFPYARWSSQVSELRATFAAAQPFPSVVFDDFLTAAAAERARITFPSPASDGWIHYIHANERKRGMRDRRTLSPALLEILDELNSPRFITLLEEITGIRGLLPDESLEGAGIHLVERDGFLNMHADFNVHPHRPTWRRRLNLLIYLNPGWEESWGGQIELWDSGMQNCIRKVNPIFNRAVLFRTDDTSFHGHPDPLICPPDQSRKSIVLYYYTEEATPPRARSTDHRARPTDTLRTRALMRLSRIALHAYDRTKRRFGFDDDFANWLLKTLFHRPPRD